MNYQGVDGSIELQPEGIVIRRAGLVSFLSHGLTGDRVIPFRSITAVQYREANSFLNGRISFTVKGGAELGMNDDLSLHFRNKYSREFQSLRDQVQRRIAEATVGPSSSPSVSVADELEKLAKLRASGVLSEAEFAAQKRRLLGN